LFFFQLLLFSNNFRILALINLFSPWYFDSFNNLKISSEFMFQYRCNYHELCQNFYSIIHFVFMKFIFIVKHPLWCVTKFSTIGRCLGQHQTKSNEWMVFWTWHCFPIIFLFFNYCPQQICFKNVSRVLLLGFHHLDDLKTWKRWLCVGFTTPFPLFCFSPYVFLIMYMDFAILHIFIVFITWCKYVSP